MNKPPLSPINDYVFKRVFGENLTVLSDLLQAVLAMPVTKHDICVVNPIFAADKKQDKLSALDVKVETRDYGVIDVEIQLEYYDDLWKRFQYYTARMYVDQIRSGDDYAKLTRAISIVITDFSFFMHDIAYHHRFRMYDAQNGLEYPGSIEINILEIPKRRGNISKVVHPDVAYSWDEEDDKNVDMGSNRGKQITLEKAESPCPQVSFTMRSVCLAMSM